MLTLRRRDSRPENRTSARSVGRLTNSPISFEQPYMCTSPINLFEYFTSAVPHTGTPLTWGPNQSAYLVGSLAAVVVAWLGTRYHEHPFRRWLKIFATAGIVCLMLKAMGHFQAVRSPVFVGIADKQAYCEAVEMVLSACLGAILLWADTLSGLVANLVMGILEPTEVAYKAHDFRPVEGLMRKGKSRAALALLKRMRAKTQESLLIKARIHQNLGEFSRARSIYKSLLLTPGNVSRLTISTLLVRLN